MGLNMSDLDDILNGVEATTEAPAVVEEITTVEAEADVTTQTETGEEAATQEAATQTEETPSSEEVKQDNQTLVPVKALESERHKRQELEARLAALEQAKPTEDEAVPDMYEDPEGYQRHQERKAEEKDAAIEHRLFLERCEMSEMLVKNLHGEEKYLAARQAFIDESDKNPALKAQLQQSSNPALFAYEQGTKLMALAEIGDPVAYKERVFQEGYEKGLAEAKAQQDGTQKATEELAKQIPTSLADEQTAGGRSTEKWSGPEPMDQLLPN